MITAPTGRWAMNDDTRKLRMVFGVSVTDYEAEAERLVARAAQVSTYGTEAELVALLKEGADPCREWNTRWPGSRSGSSPSRPARRLSWRKRPPGRRMRPG
jgi:hypothetical protein